MTIWFKLNKKVIDSEGVCAIIKVIVISLSTRESGASLFGGYIKASTVVYSDLLYKFKKTTCKQMIVGATPTTCDP